MDDKDKDENSQALNSSASIINRTEEEESFIERLMSNNLPLKVINYVISTIIPCEQNMIELEK